MKDLGPLQVPLVELSARCTEGDPFPQKTHTHTKDTDFTEWNKLRLPSWSVFFFFAEVLWTSTQQQLCLNIHPNSPDAMINLINFSALSIPQSLPIWHIFHTKSFSHENQKNKKVPKVHPWIRVSKRVKKTGVIFVEVVSSRPQHDLFAIQKGSFLEGKWDSRLFQGNLGEGEIVFQFDINPKWWCFSQINPTHDTYTKNPLLFQFGQIVGVPLEIESTFGQWIHHSLFSGSQLGHSNLANFHPTFVEKKATPFIPGQLAGFGQSFAGWRWSESYLCALGTIFTGWKPVEQKWDGFKDQGKSWPTWNMMSFNVRNLDLSTRWGGELWILFFFWKMGGGGWVVGWKGISRRVVTYGRISVVCVFKKTTSLWRIYWMIWCYVPQQIRVEHGWGLLSFLHLFFWWWFLLAFKPYKRNKSVVWVICGGYTTCVYNDYPPN